MGTLIGIGGVSRSGKSVLAEKIKSHFDRKKVLILSQDDFVNEEKNIPKVRDRTDWEHPDSIDIEGLLQTIDENKNSIDLLIVEGLLAFHFPKLDQRYDLRISVNISKKTFLSRRKKETRWGEEPTWFWEHVWDSYLKYGQISRETAFHISGETPITKRAFEEIVRNINI
ncbi:MAG: AAA family ATPase [Cytophagales bacterium]|nr:AAA family ATPase [Cytophagales bacterium]